MANPSKAKGCGFERELVQQATDSGLEAKRAWGSNGEALGCHATVDLVIEDQKLQAKRRKSVPAWLGMSEHVDAVVVRADYQEAVVLISWFDYLDYLKWRKEHVRGSRGSATEDSGDDSQQADIRQK